MSKLLKIHTAFAFIVDEADMTLDMGFLNEVDQIASRLPEKLQFLVFSATIPEKLRPFCVNIWKIQSSKKSNQKQ